MAKENSSPKEKFHKNTGIFGPKTLILALFGLFYGENFPRFSVRDGVPLQSANIFWQNNFPLRGYGGGEWGVIPLTGKSAKYLKASQSNKQQGDVKMSNVWYDSLHFVKTIHLVGSWQSGWTGGYHYQGHPVNLVHIPQKVHISKAHHQTWQRQMTKSILVQYGGALSF